MPTNTTELMLRRLGAGTAASGELERLLGQSQTTVSRQLRQLIAAGSVVRLGTTRGARYAALRAIEGIGAQWPLRRIDAAGRVHRLGVLHSLAAGEFYFAPEVPRFAAGGVSAGLPYFLQDLRPAGFLGRAVPRQHPDLGLPQRVADWNDDHFLRYLTQRGADTLGDLILGDTALDRYLAQQGHPAKVLEDERATRYPQLAAEVMAGGLPGSSAHGEQPKFATALEAAAGVRSVLVKFSPPLDTPAGRRWSDLLVSEHLAHEVLDRAGVPAARSRVEHYGDRCFLEVERFDRRGAEGRVGVTSMLALDASRYGQLDHWVDSATRLHRDRLIDAGTLERIRLVDTFGALIANSDRHFGNLAFFDAYDGQFTLAPVYDMLPMLFAPERDEVFAREFEPPGPTSSTLRAYARARALAETYWRDCARDARISDDFRAIAAACEATLGRLPRTGAYALDADSPREPTMLVGREIDGVSNTD